MISKEQENLLFKVLQDVPDTSLDTERPEKPILPYDELMDALVGGDTQKLSQLFTAVSKKNAHELHRVLVELMYPFFRAPNEEMCRIVLSKLHEVDLLTSFARSTIHSSFQNGCSLSKRLFVFDQFAIQESKSTRERLGQIIFSFGTEPDIDHFLKQPWAADVLKQNVLNHTCAGFLGKAILYRSDFIFDKILDAMSDKERKNQDTSHYLFNATNTLSQFSFLTKALHRRSDFLDQSQRESLFKDILKKPSIAEGMMKIKEARPVVLSLIDATNVIYFLTYASAAMGVAILRGKPDLWGKRMSGGYDLHAWVAQNGQLSLIKTILQKKPQLFLNKITHGVYKGKTSFSLMPKNVQAKISKLLLLDATKNATDQKPSPAPSRKM